MYAMIFMEGPPAIYRTQLRIALFRRQDAQFSTVGIIYTISLAFSFLEYM